MRTGKLLLWTLVTMLVCGGVYVALFLYVDRDVDRAAHAALAGGPVHNFSAIIATVLDTKVWAGAMALIGLIGLVLYLRQSQLTARPLLLFAGAIAIAFAVAAAAKIGLGRYRPSELFAHNKYGFHFMSTKHEHNSTPSGHTTAAFAGLLGVGLAMRRRWLTGLLLLLAAGIGTTRVLMTAHYPSDVLFGAFVGCFGALWARRILDWWYLRKELDKPDDGPPDDFLEAARAGRLFTED